MQLQRALIGGVIGGAIGIGLLVAAYFLFGSEHTAMAIVVALSVGFGVRAMAATHGHASYARGALAAILAIAAFVGGKYVVAEIARKQAVSNMEESLSKVAPPPSRPLADSTAEVGEPGETGDAAVDPAADEAESATQEQVPQTQMQASQRPAPRTGDAPSTAPKTRRSFSTLDFLLVCVGAFVAYELGRGSGNSATGRAVAQPPLPE